MVGNGRHIFCHYFKCSSDTAIKEFIRFLDEKQLLGKRFIIKDLDEHHLFISEGVSNQLQVRNPNITPPVS